MAADPPSLTRLEQDVAAAFLDAEAATTRDLAAALDLDPLDLIQILARPHVAAWIEAALAVEALREDIQARRARSLALQTLTEVAKNPKTDPTERRRAATAILRALAPGRSPLRGDSSGSPPLRGGPSDPTDPSGSSPLRGDPSDPTDPSGSSPLRGDPTGERSDLLPLPRPAAEAVARSATGAGERPSRERSERSTLPFLPSLPFSVSNLTTLNLPTTPTRAEQQTQSLAAATSTPESLFTALATAFTHDTDESTASAIHALCARPLQAEGPESLTSLAQCRTATLERSETFEEGPLHCQQFTFHRATEVGSATSVSARNRAPNHLTIQVSLRNYGHAAPRWRIAAIDVIAPETPEPGEPAHSGANPGDPDLNMIADLDPDDITPQFLQSLTPRQINAFYRLGQALQPQPP
ncbi:MAG: hypothetical protein ACF8R7_11100 [Phycisphaerales bacterium JB039]